jgi:RNase P subunit RPR2
MLYRITFHSVQLRQVCQAHSTPLPRSVDQLTCARCETLLLPGVNSRVLSGRPKKRPDNRAVLYHCLACTHAGAFPGDSRAAERSAKAEQAAREKIKQLASEAVVERPQQGPKRKRAKGGLLNLKALAKGGKTAVPFEDSPGLPVLDRPSTLVTAADDLAVAERGSSAVRSSVPKPLELVEGLEAARSGHPGLSEAVSTLPATVEGAAINTADFSNPEDSTKPGGSSGPGGLTTSEALTTPERFSETNPDNSTIPYIQTDPKGLSKPEDKTNPKGLRSSQEISEAEPLPALEPSDEPRLQTQGNQTQGSPSTMAAEAASDEIQAISLSVGGLLYSAFGEGVTAQTRTEAPPLEVPLTENLRPQTPSGQVGASLAAETGPPHIGVPLPAEGRSAQIDVSPPAETPPPQKKRPLGRTSGRSVLGLSMAAKASQGGRQASPQAPGGAEKVTVDEGNAQQDDPKDNFRSSLGGGAPDANQSLHNGGHEAAGASTVNAGALSGAPPAPSKEASPKTLNPATEMESSIDTETTRGRMSLRRSARKEGPGEALGAPPRKDEGATSETPIRRSLHSAGGGSVPAETGTPLRRSTRRGGSVEPVTKKAVATPGRRSVRNGGGNEPGGEPHASRSARRGGSKERSVELEKLPDKEGAVLKAEVGEGSRKEGGDGRKLGAIFELLDAPAGLADPSGGVHGAPGQSSQETFLTATQESIAPGSEPQAEAAPPPEEPLVELQESQLEVTTVKSPAKLSGEVPPGPAQTKSPEGANPISVEEKEGQMEGGDGEDFSFPGVEKAGALDPLPLQSELLSVSTADSDNPCEITEAAPATKEQVKSPVKEPEGQVKSPIKEQTGQVGTPANGEMAKMNAQGDGKGLSGKEAAVGQAGIVAGKEETSQEEKAAVLGEALETVEEVLREVERVETEEGGKAELGEKSGASPPARKRPLFSLGGELDTEAFPAAKRPAFPSPVLIVPLSEGVGGREQVGPVEEKPAALHAYKSAQPESGQGPSGQVSLSPEIISAIGLKEVIPEPGVQFASEMEPPARVNSAPAVDEPPGEQNGTLSRSGSEQGSKVNLGGDRETRFPPEGIHTSEEALGSWQTLADGLLMSPLSNLGVEGSLPPTPTPGGPLVGGDVTQEKQPPKDDVTQEREQPNDDVTEADDRTVGWAIPGGLEPGGGGKREALVPSALALGGVFVEEQERGDTGQEGADVIPPKDGRSGPASGSNKVAQAASESGKAFERRPGKSEGWWGEQAGLSSEQQR